MHYVVQITEHQKTPQQRGHEINTHIQKRYSKEPEHSCHEGNQQRRRDEPFHTDVAQGDTTAGGIVILM